MLKIETLVVGELEANCYIVSCLNESVVIDPGGEAERILMELKRSRLSLRYIINTHGHIDHTAANLKLSKATAAPVLIHKDDVRYLKDPILSLSLPLGHQDTVGPPDRMLEDGEIIRMAGLRLEVIHTPGHTPGGIVLSLYESEKDDPVCLFTGDTLFKNGIGRTDLPGGSYQRLIESIRDRLFILPDKTIIYPGHGPASSISYERRNNPFLK